VEGLLAGRALAVRFSGPTVDEVLAVVERDKKRRGGKVPMVLVGAPGEVTPGHEVAPAELRAAVSEVREG
ncbi:MAG: 3-dehydroquinate synthase, partial [Actinomycetota bacterium]|nr:3-dehydroquinate synthase [Actinomycetota bacterium]